MKMKNKKSLKLKINHLLIALICCTPILTIILLTIGNSTQNSMYIIWSIAIYPILGIIAIPNIILHAFSENKLEEKDFIIRKAFFDKYYISVENTEKYYKMVRLDLIKKSIIAFIVTTVVILSLLILFANWYVNNGPNHLNDRPIILKIFHPSREVEGRIFLITFFLLIFGLPIIEYVISIYIHKILLFKKKFCCYKVIVENIDFDHNLHVKSVNNFNGFKLNRKHKRNVFENFKCIGINEKDILNKEVIMIIIPGFVYLINE